MYNDDNRFLYGNAREKIFDVELGSDLLVVF